MKKVNENEMCEIAKIFAKKLDKGSIIILNGELGAGKTTFVKGLAKGLGIKQNISSPTFSIIKEYEKKLCHIDAYRIFGEDIDIPYYLDRGYIICIEWSENIIDFIPKIDYIINISYSSDNMRCIEIK